MRFLILLASFVALFGCGEQSQPEPEPEQGRLSPLKEEVDQVEPIREKFEKY